MQELRGNYKGEEIMENKELLNARKSKKLAEALTDKTVKILKYGSEYTVITGEEKIQDAVDCGWGIVE